MSKLLIRNTCKWFASFSLFLQLLSMFVSHTYLPRHTHRVHTHMPYLSLSPALSLPLSLSNTDTHTHKDMLALSLGSLHLLPRKEEEEK